MYFKLLTIRDPDKSLKHGQPIDNSHVVICDDVDTRPDVSCINLDNPWGIRATYRPATREDRDTYSHEWWAFVQSFASRNLTPLACLFADPRHNATILNLVLAGFNSIENLASQRIASERDELKARSSFNISDISIYGLDVDELILLARDYLKEMQEYREANRSKRKESAELELALEELPPKLASILDAYSHTEIIQLCEEYLHKTRIKPPDWRDTDPQLARINASRRALDQIHRAPNKAPKQVRDAQLDRLNTLVAEEHTQRRLVAETERVAKQQTALNSATPEQFEFQFDTGPAPTRSLVLNERGEWDISNE